MFGLYELGMVWCESECVCMERFVCELFEVCGIECKWLWIVFCGC